MTETHDHDALRHAMFAPLCHDLRLPGVLRAYPALCRHARDGGWPYEDLLREALLAEQESRHKSAVERRIREAGFGEPKTLDDFDWSFQSGVSRPKMLELASCDFVKKGETVVLVGPIGTGKSHLAVALGVCAARKRYRELLFNLLADRYEAAATVVTSNLAFGEWVQVFGSEKLTTALLDRLTHHAHILTTKGSSYRLKSRRPE